MIAIYIVFILVFILQIVIVKSINYPNPKHVQQVFREPVTGYCNWGGYVHQNYGYLDKPYYYDQDDLGGSDIWNDDFKSLTINFWGYDFNNWAAGWNTPYSLRKYGRNYRNDDRFFQLYQHTNNVYSNIYHYEPGIGNYAVGNYAYTFKFRWLYYVSSIDLDNKRMFATTYDASYYASRTAVHNGIHSSSGHYNIPDARLYIASTTQSGLLAWCGLMANMQFMPNFYWLDSSEALKYSFWNSGHQPPQMMGYYKFDEKDQSKDYIGDHSGFDRHAELFQPKDPNLDPYLPYIAPNEQVAQRNSTTGSFILQTFGSLKIPTYTITRVRKAAQYKLDEHRYMELLPDTPDFTISYWFKVHGQVEQATIFYRTSKDGSVTKMDVKHIYDVDNNKSNVGICYDQTLANCYQEKDLQLKVGHWQFVAISFYTELGRPGHAKTNQQRAIFYSANGKQAYHRNVMPLYTLYVEETDDITYIGSPYNTNLDTKNFIELKEFKIFKGVMVIQKETQAYETTLKDENCNLEILERYGELFYDHHCLLCDNDYANLDGKCVTKDDCTNGVANNANGMYQLFDTDGEEVLGGICVHACSAKCATCNPSTPTQCQTCAYNRIDPPSCGCPQYTFDSHITGECVTYKKKEDLVAGYTIVEPFLYHARRNITQVQKFPQQFQRPYIPPTVIMGHSKMEIERNYRTNYEYYPWDEHNHYSQSFLQPHPINQKLFITDEKFQWTAISPWFYEAESGTASAHAMQFAHPYFATTDKIRFQKGFTRIRYQDGGDFTTLNHVHVGTRTYDIPVVFDTPYPAYLGTPKVIAYVSSMIRWHGYHWKTDVDVKDITNDGFTIVFTAFDATHVEQVGFSWVAFPDYLMGGQDNTFVANTNSSWYLQARDWTKTQLSTKTLDQPISPNIDIWYTVTSHRFNYIHSVYEQTAVMLQRFKGWYADKLEIDYSIWGHMLVDYVKTPFIVLADYCDVMHKCEDNKCDFFGGCIKCVAEPNRKPAPSCECQDGYYEDAADLTCKNCDENCFSCHGNPTTCISCNDEMYISETWTCNFCQPPCVNCLDDVQCLSCPFGYAWIREGFQCIPCVHECTSCEDRNDKCLTCKGDRQFQFEDYTCNCPDKKWDDDTSLECLDCKIECATCDQGTTCLTCAGNRIFDTNQCPCPAPVGTEQVVEFDTDVDNPSYWCDTCDLGFLRVQVGDDLTSIVIKFAGPVTLLPVQDTQEIAMAANCDGVFERNVTQSLGIGYTCQLVSGGQTLMAFTGKVSTIIPGDFVTFLPGAILKQNCPDTYIEFVNNDVKLPTFQTPPIAELIGPTNPLSVCAPISMFIGSVSFDGFKGLDRQEWQLTKMDPHVQVGFDKVNDFLATLNEFKSPKVEFPATFLEVTTEYTFTLLFSSFFGVSNYNQTVINTLYKEGPDIQFDDTVEYTFPIWKINPLKVIVQHFKCIEEGKYEIIKDSIDLEWKQASGDEDLGVNKVSVTTGDDPEDSVNIQTYLAKSNTTYIVNVTATLQNVDVSATFSQVIFFEPSELEVRIEGGSRVAGVSDPLELKGEAFDPDVDPSENDQTVGIVNVYTCIDLTTGDPCLDAREFPLTFKENSVYQIYQKNMLAPYKAYEFTLNATKGGRYKEAKAIIIMQEFNIPILEITVPPGIEDNPVNLNDEIYMVMNYDPNYDVDTLFYSAQVTYEFDLKATIVFDFKTVRFKIWQYFSDFNQGDLLTLRFSVYNPVFTMPSLNTLNVKINIPPAKCVMKVSPEEGLAMYTKFKLIVDGCKDDDMPLRYKFLIYDNQKELNEEILNPKNPQQNIISDFDTSFFINNLYLPMSAIGEELVIMGSVSDKRGGITNVTLSMQVEPNIKVKNNQIESYIQDLNEHVQNTLPFPLKEQIQMFNSIIMDMDIGQYAYNQPTITQTYEKNVTTTVVDGEGNETTEWEIKEIEYEVPNKITNITAELQTSMLNSLYKLQKEILPQSTMDQQIARMIKLIMKNSKNLFKTLPSSDISNQLGDLTNTISSKSGQMDKIPMANRKQSETRVADKVDNLLINSLGIIDGMMDGIDDDDEEEEETNNDNGTAEPGSTDDDGDNTQVDENGNPIVDNTSTDTGSTSSGLSKAEQQDQQNQQMMAIAQNSQATLLKNALPNEKAKAFNGSGSQMVAQVITKKYINQFLGIEKSDWKADLNEGTVTDGEADPTDQQYDIGFKNYKKNPFKKNKNFPNKKNKWGVIDPDIKAAASQSPADASKGKLKKKIIHNYLQENVSAIEDDLTYDPNTIGGQGYIFRHVRFLTEEEKQVEKVCISQGSGNAWDDSTCKKIETQNDDGSVSIECHCGDLSVATLLDDVDGLFANNKNLQTLSDPSATLDVLANMEYYKFAMFYILIILTLIYIGSIIYGIKQDKRDAAEMKQKEAKDKKQKYLDKEEQDYLKLIGEQAPTNSIQIEHGRSQDNIAKKTDKTKFQDMYSITMHFSGQMFGKYHPLPPNLTKKEKKKLEAEKKKRIEAKRIENIEKEIGRLPTIIAIFSQHKLFQSYVIFEKLYSRPVRHTFFYINAVLYMALTIVFSEGYTFIQTMVLSILIGVVYGICLTLLKVLFKRTVTKIFAVFILICILAISYIAALVSAANMGPEEANYWALEWASTFIMDTLIIESITCSSKFGVLRFVFNKKVSMRTAIDALIVKVILSDAIKNFWEDQLL